MRYFLGFFVFTVLVVKQTHSNTGLLAFPSDSGGIFTEPNFSPVTKLTIQSNHESKQSSKKSNTQSQQQSQHKHMGIISGFGHLFGDVVHTAVSGFNAVGTLLSAMKGLQKFINADVDQLTIDYNNLIQSNNVANEILLLPKAYTDIIAVEHRLLNSFNEIAASAKTLSNLPVPFVGILTSGIKPYLDKFPSFSANFADVISTTQQIGKIVDQNVVPQVQQSNSAVIRLPASITNKAVTILHQMANDFKEMAAYFKNAMRHSNTKIPFLSAFQSMVTILSTKYEAVAELIERFITACNIPSDSVSGDITIDLTHGIKIVNEYIPGIIDALRELRKQLGPLIDLVAMF